MHNFSYVSKKEAAPYKNEIISLLKLVQKEVKKYFTFRFDFVGSSSRNMITCERNGNIGYDFDVNIEPNDPEENYPASNIRRFIFEAVQKHMGKYGYTKIENSTSVITIKAIDRNNRRIEHSCDFAIVFHCSNGKQQYIRYNKNSCSFSWEYRGNDYYIGDKFQWIKDNHLKEELRERYLNYKNRNNDPEKHSRTILAETVNDLYNEYTYRRR